MTSTEERVASSGPPTTPVSPNGDFTLSNIIRVLRPLEDKYDALGTHLGVKLEDLKRIEGDYPKNARRFTETIGFWQNNCRNPSWSVLADAVEKIGGHGGLVQKLRASESLKSEDAGYSSKGGDSPSRYSSGSDVEYFDKVPGCSCDKPCSVYTVSSRRCPRPTNTEVGIVRKRTENQATQDVLLPEEMVDSEEEDYMEEFEKETKQMRVLFAGLVNDVCDSFEKRNVKLDRAVLFLQNAHPLLKPRINEMTKASNIDQVLTIVTDQACSWFDYEIIKDLVGKFGDDHDRKLVGEYEAKFKKFVEQRKLPNGKKHIEVGRGARKEFGGKQLLIKIDKEWNEVNFNDLDKIRGNLASILNIKRRDLYLADIREGCVMLTFMITEELAKTLFPKKSDLTSSKLSSYFSSTRLKLLQDEGIILLTCGKVSWRPAMDQSLPEPKNKSLGLIHFKPLDSFPGRRQSQSSSKEHQRLQRFKSLNLRSQADLEAFFNKAHYHILTMNQQPGAGVVSGQPLGPGDLVSTKQEPITNHEEEMETNQPLAHQHQRQPTTKSQSVVLKGMVTPPSGSGSGSPSFHQSFRSHINPTGQHSSPTRHPLMTSLSPHLGGILPIRPSQLFSTSSGLTAQLRMLHQRSALLQRIQQQQMLQQAAAAASGGGGGGGSLGSSLSLGSSGRTTTNPIQNSITADGGGGLDMTTSGPRFQFLAQGGTESSSSRGSLSSQSAGASSGGLNRIRAPKSHIPSGAAFQDVRTMPRLNALSQCTNKSLLHQGEQSSNSSDVTFSRSHDHNSEIM